MNIEGHHLFLSLIFPKVFLLHHFFILKHVRINDKLALHSFKKKRKKKQACTGNDHMIVSRKKKMLHKLGSDKKNY